MKLAIIFLLIGLLSITRAVAGCSPGSIDETTVLDARTKFLIALAKRESSLDPLCVNKYGYLGLFQMGEGALSDAAYYHPDRTPRKNDWIGAFTERAKFDGVLGVKSYLDQPGSQELAVRAFHDRNWQRIEDLGLSSYVGRTIGGIRMSMSGMTAGAHLVGVGALQDFIDSNGSDVDGDANNTTITEYMKSFGGFY